MASLEVKGRIYPRRSDLEVLLECKTHTTST
jgi:hypothetical protein